MVDEEYILAKIQALMPDEHAVPRAVLYPQLKTAVQQDVVKSLNALFKQGKIGYHKTLCGLSIYIK